MQHAELGHGKLGTVIRGEVTTVSVAFRTTHLVWIRIGARTAVFEVAPPLACRLERDAHGRGAITDSPCENVHRRILVSPHQAALQACKQGHDSVASGTSRQALSERREPGNKEADVVPGCGAAAQAAQSVEAPLAGLSNAPGP